MQTTAIAQLFYEQEVPQRRLRYLLALEDYFQGNREQLVTQFQQDFQQICEQLVQQQTLHHKEPIGNITISLLRTELLEGNYRYVVEATTGKWIFDAHPIVTTYDATWALQFLKQFIEELALYSKVFAGTISQVEIEALKLQEAKHFHQYIASLARYALREGITCLAYEQLKREADLEIRIGEFFDYSETVYREGTPRKTVDELKEWLSEKVANDYAYENFRQLDLSNGVYHDTDLRYAFFEQSHLAKSELCSCALIGTNFKNSNLIGANLSDSTIHEANFSFCQLQGANFQQVQGAVGLHDRQQWDMPGFYPVQFTGANLERANFTGADLRGACFLGTTLRDTRFAEANLEGAIFSQEAQGQIQFTPKQAAEVIWQ
ncbi:pentapeptide repeat-containing protein [Metasolibacillus meyeri]|uniref:Pentapeptide repeat-containing protein n=1 Tax=Metasolibacillus meyeri TaxID=1071052 RepID=A0AAW9NYV9_9BACL|nr:pentapeptide repeat-containing protein [Metasolibacillus meyeri]MEC1180053.1 pentapeptide repeat-containing protein [Metasolibacillus meyeri]